MLADLLLTVVSTGYLAVCKMNQEAQNCPGEMQSTADVVKPWSHANVVSADGKAICWDHKKVIASDFLTLTKMIKMIKRPAHDIATKQRNVSEPRK